jgi:hypothetical protein
VGAGSGVGEGSGEGVGAGEGSGEGVGAGLGSGVGAGSGSAQPATTKIINNTATVKHINFFNFHLLSYIILSIKSKFLPGLLRTANLLCLICFFITIIPVNSPPSTKSGQCG